MQELKNLNRIDSPSMYKRTRSRKDAHRAQLENSHPDMTAFKRKPYYMTIRVGGAK